MKISLCSVATMMLAVMIVLAGCTSDSRVVEKPKETITIERAQDLYRAYDARFDALTQHRNGKEDARYGWHSIAFYKNYIAYLEQEAKKANLEVSGLRLYYAAYPNDAESEEHADYQTYMFVPTYFDKETNKHVAFDPLHLDDNGKPIPIHDVITKGLSPKVFRKAAMREATVSSIANMGEMCKPNCIE